MTQNYMYFLCEDQDKESAKSLIKKLSENGGPGAIVLLTAEEHELMETMHTVPIGPAPEARDGGPWIALVKHLITMHDHANDDSDALLSRVNSIADSYFDGSGAPPKFCSHGRMLNEFCAQCGRVHGGN